MTTHSTDPLDPVNPSEASITDPTVEPVSYETSTVEPVAYETASYDSSGSDSSSKADVAKGEAQNVKNAAADATSQVTGTAKEQATQVASDVRDQTRQLADETRTQLSTQVSGQRDRAVGGLRSLGDELRGLTSDDADSKPAPGLATQFAKEGADLTHKVADFIEHREPAELLDELRSFARRKPGAFLVGAALAGVVVGRLTRGAVAARQDDNDSSGSADFYARDTSAAPASYLGDPALTADQVAYPAQEPSYGTGQMDKLAYPADGTDYAADPTSNVGAESTSFPTEQGYRS